jgi:hypothetical protein
MPEQNPTYDDLNIRLQRGDGNRYHTVASAADGATASGSFVLPFDETEVDNFVLRVGRQRLAVRSYRSAQMEAAKEFGSRLFEALIVDDVRDVYRSARAIAEKSHKGLRVTMCLTDVPELMDIPWEFLYERPRFLSQSIYSPIVRSLDLAEAPPPYRLNLPLNVVGMVSSPRGFETLDVEREKEKLANALAPLCSQGVVTVEWLKTGTLRELDEALSRRHEIHVFHYIGHGAYDSRTDGGILVLENDRGDPHEISGEELGLLLQDERSLRLAILNSCEGARSSHLDPFSGVASSLVQYGVPAVVGMQFEITDEAAIAFADRLYDSLSQGFPVDAALAQARRSIFANGNDIEFGTPVLFLRSNEAHLFDVIDPSAVEAREPPESTGAMPPPPIEPQRELMNYPSAEADVQPSDHSSEEQDFVPDWHLSSSLTWLPKPWQEFIQEGVASNLRGALRHAPNRPLVLLFGLLLVAGILVTSIFGHESTSGDRQNIWGSILTLVGFFGLCWVAFRAVSSRLRDHYRRLRDWWTGSR